VARQHFACDLGVTRFVSSYESDELYSGDEEKTAECNESKDVNRAASAVAWAEF